MKKFIWTFLTFFLVTVISFNKASPSFAAATTTSTGICHQVSELSNPNVTWAYTVGEGKWSTLEPQRGIFNWDALDASIAAVAGVNKKIWIQVDTDDGSPDTIPQWAVNAGMHRFPSDYNKNVFDMGRPVQWDPKYLEFLQEVLTAMAERYDNNSGNNSAIEAILMMSGGHYGEMSLHGQYARPNEIKSAYLNEMADVTGVSVDELIRVRPVAYCDASGQPANCWPRSGRVPPPVNNPKYLFEQKYVESVFKLIDIYAQTFKNKPVVLQLGTPGFSENMDSRYSAGNAANYAVNKYGSHVWLKQNGLGNWGGADAYNGIMSPYKNETRLTREIGHPKAMCWGLSNCLRTNQADACTWNTETINNTVGAGVSAICFQREFFRDTIHYPCIFDIPGYPTLRDRLRDNNDYPDPPPPPPIDPVIPPVTDDVIPPGQGCFFWCTMGLLGSAGDRGCCWTVGDNHCCNPHYYCALTQNRTIGQSAVICEPALPPTNTCKIAGGIFTPDCDFGKTCPATGAGTCVKCSSTNFGICYKGDAQGVINNCCGGYVCPYDMPSGVVKACEKSNERVSQLLKIINGIVLPLAIILGMILIVHNGYKLMTSQGDPTKLQEGKDGLTSAIIGLLFILMAVSILRVIIKALVTGDTDPFS